MNKRNFETVQTHNKVKMKEVPKMVYFFVILGHKSGWGKET